MANQDLNPSSAGGPQGTSYIYDMGTSPNTRAAVSQKVRLLTPAYGSQVGRTQIGVVSTFNPTFGRDIGDIRGIGFGDKVAELVPSISQVITASFERAMLYLSDMFSATGYASGYQGPVRALSHHRWPFDLETQLVFSTLADMDLERGNVGESHDAGSWQNGVQAVEFPEGVTTDPNSNYTTRGHTAVITIYEACWFNDYSFSLSKDEGQISESGGVTVTDVHDLGSIYGEFMATGNDPSISQTSSIRFDG